MSSWENYCIVLNYTLYFLQRGGPHGTHPSVRSREHNPRLCNNSLAIWHITWPNVQHLEGVFETCLWTNLVNVPHMSNIMVMIMYINPPTIRRCDEGFRMVSSYSLNDMNIHFFHLENSTPKKYFRLPRSFCLNRSPSKFLSSFVCSKSFFVRIMSSTWMSTYVKLCPWIDCNPNLKVQKIILQIINVRLIQGQIRIYWVCKPFSPIFVWNQEESTYRYLCHDYHGWRNYWHRAGKYASLK